MTCVRFAPLETLQIGHNGQIKDNLQKCQNLTPRRHVRGKLYTLHIPTMLQENAGKLNSKTGVLQERALSS